MAKYVAPEHQVTSFTCPHCGTLTSQEWEDLTAGRSSTEISQSVCYEYQEPTYWYDDWMLYPLTGNTPAPHDDMPRNAKDLYVEAQAIVTRSPRSACALLRIAIQEICEELGQKDVRLFEAIGNLVKEGRINERTQKALDAIRVRAGELAHPAQISMVETATTANQLFLLANVIVEEAIAVDKGTNAVYATLTPDQLAYVEKRDAKTAT